MPLPRPRSPISVITSGGGGDAEAATRDHFLSNPLSSPLRGRANQSFDDGSESGDTASPLGGRFSKLKMVVLAATLIILGLVIGLAVGLHGTNSSGSNGTALGSATGQTGSESEGELPEFVTNSTSSNSTSSSTPAPSPASQGGPTTPLEPTPEPLNPPSLTPAPAGGTPNPTPWSRATPAPTAPPTVPDGGSIYEAYYSQPQNIPGITSPTLRSVWFDDGGQGVAYQWYDMQDVPKVRAWESPRGVDGEVVNGYDAYRNTGYINYLTGREWLRYTVDISASGDYDVAYVLTGNVPEGQTVALGLYLSLNGDGCNPNAKLAHVYEENFDPGDWFHLRDYRASDPIYLPKGIHRIYVCFEAASLMNFYGVRFTPLFEYSLDGYTTSAPFPEDWALKWADYFDGSALDRNMWEVAVGRGCELKECGYGNGELQSYEEANVWVEGGNMVIESRKETVQGYPVGDCGDRSCSPFAGADYTSGKVVSIPPNYEVLYGRLRARIKFGEGKGLWPAFWMLPSPANDADFYTQDGVYGKWPQSGELDIVEVANDMVGSAWGLHWGTEVDHESQDCWYTGDHYYGREWLIYELQWAPWGEMRWYLDGLEVCRVPETPGMQPWWAPGGTGQAPFDQPFYVNFNVAVGGWWPGDPDDSILPQQTLIDWVEYYEWPTNRRLPEGWQKPADWDWETGWDKGNE